MTDIVPDGGRDVFRELLQVVARLKEVRRRFVREAGDGDRFDHAEQRLDDVIRDLERGLGPGDHPLELDDLELRLAAVEEMIEGLGFPKYAHVVGSIRDTMVTVSGGPGGDVGDEPPPPQRYEPAPKPIARGGSSRAAAAAPGAAVRPPDRRWRLALLIVILVLVGGLATAFHLGVVSLDRWTLADRAGTETGITPEPVQVPSPAEPDVAPTVEPTPKLEPFRVNARALGQVVHELDAAETAIDRNDIDDALRHFAAAAEIDRHHRGVVSLAGRLIDALLERSERAFDAGLWQEATRRVEDARHLASGLYLDTAEIEQVARRHAAMTRFRDLDPDATSAIRASVGRAVRVTLDTRDQLFGELEALDGDRLVLSIHSGLHGGGVEFTKQIPLEDTLQIRVYEATRVADLIL
ncbi:MAG: hypothetical protein PVG53_08365 [Holophagae bacterium]|jgi:hypothetical protein